jgi:hypothetical protein
LVSITQVPDTGNITGIINLAGPGTPASTDTVAAITRDGEFYTISGTTAASSIKISQRTKRVQSLSLGKNKNDSGRKRLLITFRGSSSTYGYGEIGLTQSGASWALPTEDDYDTPGGADSSTPYTSNAEYQNSIGKHSIIHLFQAPSTVDSDMTLFAATEQNGLWSYRDRSDGWQWNMEE